MKNVLLAGAIALAFIGPFAGADTMSSRTSTHSTTTNGVPTSSESSSTSSAQETDEHGNLIKKTQTYNSKDPATGDASSSSTSSVERPDGSKESVEVKRTSDGSYSGGSTTEKQTTTTTVR